MNYRPECKFMDLDICKIMQTYGTITFKFFRISNVKLPDTMNTRVQADFKKQMASQQYF